MSDYRDLLDKERRRFAMRDGSLEGLEQRWNRKRRNARIAAGVLALLIAAAGVGGGLYAFRSSSGLKPGVSPSFSPPPSIGPAPSETPGVVSGRLSPPSGPIQFVDAQTGWAVGPSGEILFSTDAGRTWTGQYGGPLKIVALQFVDNLHGWALSEDGLLRTTTGGGHWGPAGSPEQPLRSVQFATDLVGWGVSGPSDPSVPGTLVKSTDGGISWKLLRTPMPVQSVGVPRRRAMDGDAELCWDRCLGPGEGRRSRRSPGLRPVPNGRGRAGEQPGASRGRYSPSRGGRRRRRCPGSVSGPVRGFRPGEGLVHRMVPSV